MSALFTAISTSARQLLLLLRCISFAPKAQVLVSADGIRFTTEQGSIMEAFVFLDKSLFTSYTYNQPVPPSSQESAAPPPAFEINLTSLLETLNIFSLSDPSNTNSKHDSYTSHRLNRHAGISAFSNHALGVSGLCTLTYEGEGSPLNIHMSESGVSTTCALTTYEAEHSGEEIPFRRDAVVLKTIMRAASLLDAITELSNLEPKTVTLTATSRSLSLSAAGAYGEATVDFSTASSTSGEEGSAAILETFTHASGKSRTSTSFNFALLKAAKRAMASATKVSVRVDAQGVLSLQFLVEVEGEGQVVFVDFRIVPLVEGEAEEHGVGSGSGSDNDD